MASGFVGTTVRRWRLTIGSPGATQSGFWIFSLPRAFASAFRVGVLWLDVVLVGALISPTAAAVYTVATRLLQVGFIAVEAIGQVVEPIY